MFEQVLLWMGSASMIIDLKVVRFSLESLALAGSACLRVGPLTVLAGWRTQALFVLTMHARRVSGRAHIMVGAMARYNSTDGDFTAHHFLAALHDESERRVVALHDN